MKTALELEQAFDLYFETMREAARPGSYWSLLHVVVSLPDICAALERPSDTGQRYHDWCGENFSAGKLTPWDRYQIRNALLHQGTTLPMDRSGKRPTQYTCISYTDPDQAGADLHGLVQPDPTRGGMNLIVNIKLLADETAEAMRRWFRAVEADPVRNATVESNLRMIAAKKRKVSEVPVAATAVSLPRGMRATIVFSHGTTSSS